jgi:hypothetical protein
MLLMLMLLCHVVNVDVGLLCCNRSIAILVLLFRRTVGVTHDLSCHWCEC